MKKIIYKFTFLLLLLFPFVTLANEQDIKISNISLIEKSEDTEILNEPTYSNLDLNFEVKLQNIGDYIKFKVELSNPSPNSYLLNYNTQENNDYIEYQLDFEKEDKVINENGNTIFYLTMTKKKEAEENQYEQGIFLQTAGLDFSLIPKTQFLKANPKTKNNMQIILGIILITFIIIGYYSLKKEKKEIIPILLLSLLLFNPFQTNAEEETHLRIRTLLMTEEITSSIRKDEEVEKVLENILKIEPKKELNKIEVSRSNALPKEVTIQNQISNIGEEPIFIWTQDNILYWYSKAKKILLENSNTISDYLSNLIKNIGE